MSKKVPDVSIKNALDMTNLGSEQKTFLRVMLTAIALNAMLTTARFFLIFLDSMFSEHSMVVSVVTEKLGNVVDFWAAVAFAFGMLVAIDSRGSPVRVSQWLSSIDA